MKKIVLRFYSCHNLGDDLFVLLFAEHFSSCRIRLLVNPKCIPGELPPNVRIHPYSYLDFLLCKLIDLCDVHGITGALRLLNRFQTGCIDILKSNCDAFVKIGGSIFMQHAPGCKEIDFSTEEEVDYSFRDAAHGIGNSFIIGANLGPVYSADYWTQMEAEFRKHRHICLRDYASYSRMKDSPNVQYAPDVLFLTPMPDIKPEEENVVISVMDISRYTQDAQVVDAYYSLLEQTIGHFLRCEIPVTLASFCKWQGDEHAIRELRKRFLSEQRIAECCYRGDSKPVLEVFAGASFIIGSRFHSIVLGMNFCKPVFPIIYNCKTEHFLSDIHFAGRFAGLSDLNSATLEDVLYNYEHHIVADCTMLRRCAVNQFRGLENYLEEKTT